MQALDARAKELEAAQEECRVLQGHVDAREAADRKTAEAAAEAKRVAAQAAAESVARAAAEQEMQEMANQLKNMAIQVVSLESKEHQEEEAQAAVVAALSDELTSATRESRALTNRLEEHLKDLEQTKAALKAANEKLDDHAGHQAALDLARVREEALQREIESLKKELASSREALLGLKESAARVEALTQTATELRDDLEVQKAISRNQAKKHAGELAQMCATQEYSSAALVSAHKELGERVQWLERKLQEEAEAAVQEAERASAAEQSVAELEELLEEAKGATHEAETALQGALEREASDCNKGGRPVNEEQRVMADSLLGNLGSMNTAVEPSQAGEQQLQQQQQEDNIPFSSSRITTMAEKSVQTIEAQQQDALSGGLEGTNMAKEPAETVQRQQSDEVANIPESLDEVSARTNSAQVIFQESTLQESEDESKYEPIVDDANALANVWDLVEDFLHSAGTVHTLECLASERSIVSFNPNFAPPSSKDTRRASQRIVESLLKAFDEGRAADFADLWVKHVPPSLSRPPRSTGYVSTNQSEDGAAVWAQRVLVKAHAHFSLLPLRQRLRRARWVPSGSSSPKKGRGAVSLPKIPQAQPRSSTQHVTDGNSSRGGSSMPTPVHDSTLEAFPADAAESRALEHFRSFLASSDSAATGDPELLPLLALPQLPRPWQHPSLAAVLRPPDDDDNTAYGIENVATNVSAAKAPKDSADLAHADGPWVVSLRRELATLLETRLLLARPPRLLALHRAYSNWQSVLKDRCARTSRSAATLGEVSGELVGLCVELLQAIDAQSPGASSSTFVRHRRRLNVLRRTWQNERTTEGKASMGVQEVTAPPLFGAALKRRVEALLSMATVTTSTHSEDEPLRRLLAALGDRLSYSTGAGYEPTRVRRQTTEDLTTGDVLSLLQHPHGTDSSSSSNLTALLDPSRAHGAAALRVVALLALRPEGRHYLTSASLPRLMAALVAGLGPDARLDASCAACLALSNLLPGGHATAAAAVSDAAANAQLLPTLIGCLRRVLTMQSPATSPTSSSSSVYSPPAEALLGQGSVLLVLCGKSGPIQRWCAGELAVNPSNAPEQHHPSANNEEATDAVAELADLFNAALESLDRQCSSTSNDEDATVATSNVIEGVARCVLGCLLCLVQAHSALRQRATRLNLASRWRGRASLSEDLEWQLECVAKAAAAPSGKGSRSLRSSGDTDEGGSDQNNGDDLNPEDEEAAFEVLENTFDTRSDALMFESVLQPYYMAGPPHGSLPPLPC